MIKVDLNDPNYLRTDELVDWCLEHFDFPRYSRFNPPRWQWFRRHNGVIFQFRDDGDAVLFCLRWK